MQVSINIPEWLAYPLTAWLVLETANIILSLYIRLVEHKLWRRRNVRF